MAELYRPKRGNVMPFFEEDDKAVRRILESFRVKDPGTDGPEDKTGEP
jgi:hypothetical protein